LPVQLPLTLSVTPSQLSSTPLHASATGDPAVTPHVPAEPLHTIDPVRRHAPVPTEHELRASTQVVLQRRKPGGQTDAHDPATHARVPPLGAMHTRPQAPQWSALLLVATSQPLRASPSQSA